VNKANDIPLILFAKQPNPGLVKTRLQPELSKGEAAEVAEVLLHETLKLATNTWRGKVVLAVWPDENHPFIQEQLRQFDVECIQQVEGDLGEKMLAAMNQLGYPCAVMGCDAPHCRAETLDDAYNQLSDKKNVIAPTDDGGYYLLGLIEQCPEIFSLDAWGGDTVLDKTRSLAEGLNMDIQELSQLQDIDTYQDLLEASRDMEVLQRFIKA